MSSNFRLAVIAVGNDPVAIIEREGRYIPVADVFGEPVTDLSQVLIDWPAAQARIEAFVAANGSAFASAAAVDGAKFMPPLANPGKIVCIGANYHDHIAEMATPMTPKYPYSFLKPGNNTLRGSGDAVAVPRGVSMMDYEAELCAVIGVQCANVSAADALGVIAGYANFNDLSARDWLESRPPIGVDWVWHKAFDGFAPIGPYIVPAKFVGDPQALGIRLTVNDEVRQDSSTAGMVYGVAAIIEHLTKIMTLMPGDIIATGTPAGVGHGRKPPHYLSAGDEVRMEIAGLGELVTPIVGASA